MIFSKSSRIAYFFCVQSELEVLLVCEDKYRYVLKALFLDQVLEFFTAFLETHLV